MLRHDSPGRMKVDIPSLCGHTAAVLDFEFNPFNDYIIATGSEDKLIKLWSIPEEGLTHNITQSLVDLEGHNHKVTLMRFHPTADCVLASTSGDLTVKLWDVEKAMEISSLNEVHKDLVQELLWDLNGNQIATSSRDKCIRLIDARANAVSSVIENAHDGIKSIKLAYLGHTHKLFSVGFTKSSTRQMKIWDPRKANEEIFRVEMDVAAGVIMPFFDIDTNVLYLAGKGDGNVRCYEVNAEGDSLTALTDFRTNVSGKGMAMVPKRGLNIMGNESARLLKLTNNSVEPLSFIVPRKAEGFQEDIFPETFSGEPSHTAAEWLAGSDQPPRLMSLNPASGQKSARSSTASTRVYSVRTVPALMAELEQAQARIQLLEERLAAAGLSVE